MTDDRLRRILLTVATCVTVVLTGAAFALSYDHLATVARTHGLDGVAAWSWPGCVDMFIAVGELLVFRARLRGDVDWPAIVAAVVGSVGSIALNVAGAGAGATALTYIVDAVPPAAAMLAFGLLMYQVHTYLDAQQAPVAATTAPEPALAVAKTAAPKPAAPRPERPEPAAQRRTTAPVPDPRPAGAPAAAREDVQRVAAWLADGRDLTGTIVAAELNIPPRTARRVLSAARAHRSRAEHGDGRGHVTQLHRETA